jgi:hypothetical protein
MTDDGWEKVAAAPADDGWEPVTPAERPAPVVGEAIPEAFIGRLRAGQALGRVLQAAGKGAVEGAGTGTPTGFEDDWLNYMIEKGVFHDPATGRGGPLQMVAEAGMMPTAQLWQTITRATSGAIHGAGEAMGQIVDEFGGSQGTANRAKNEVINFGNWAMIEGGMGRFSRPSVEQATVMDRAVGGLPTEADFSNAAKVLYHGTNREFSTFDASKLQSASGSKDAAKGFYFTDDPEIASYFADSPKKGRIIAAELDIKNPKTITLDKASGLDKTQSIQEAFDAGHDAVIFHNSSEGKGPVSTTYVVKDPEQITQRETHLQYIEGNLRRMWREDGIHPAEAVHDAQTDAFVKHEITAPREEIKPPPEVEQVLEETGGKPGSLSAAMTDPADIPSDVQPPRPPSSLVATAQAAAETLFDVGRDIQMKLAPMARGSVESMATVKDYMNAMRRNAWDVSRIDTDTMKRFDPEQRARLANAMEEESLSRRLGEPESAREHQGLATLAPEERAFVESENTRQQLAWLKARDLGMVEGDGIEMHYPRMVVGLPKGLDAATEGQLSLNAIGYDLRSRTPFAKQRKHIELEDTEKAIKAKVAYALKEQGKTPEEVTAAVDKVQVVRDIRAVNLATKQLEDAVAGRTLVENIKDVGKRTGDETVAVGFKPDDGWFTVDHPSFKQWRPKFAEVDGKVEAVKDSAGNAVFEQVPIYVRGDFEGPLRSAMWGKSGAAYSGLMALKGKTMGLIMNSPAIHNLVEFGRALPAMPIRMMTPVVGDGGVLSPVRIKVYADGFRAKNDPAVMHEAIDAGLVPIGKRFFNQDISSMMETPDLTPGRSITAKALALVPGLFDEGAGSAVKQAIDKAGDFWHNRLLWDKIADLQAGLYVNIRGDLVGKGMDQQTASRVAAHYANRYAGALPKEAMSEMATKVANTMLFSRSFTLGNLGVMKDMLTGLPKDVLAQIERDGGFREGAIDEAQILPELPKGLSLKEMPNSVGNQEYSLVDAEGKEHYRASVSNGADDGFPGYHGVSWIENTSRDYTGVGPALYREIARSVENRGGKLLVGLSASAKAIKVHGELEKLGLAEPFDVNTLKPGLSAEIDAAEHMTGNRPNPMIVRSEPKPDTGVLAGKLQVAMLCPTQNQWRDGRQSRLSPSTLHSCTPAIRSCRARFTSCSGRVAGRKKVTNTSDVSATSSTMVPRIPCHC